MNRTCDAGGICKHSPQCEHFCHFTEAGLEPVYIKSAPLIRFVDEPEPVPEAWQTIGSILFGLATAMLLVISFALFFTGLWMWSLLI
jgi:hypothetical protein